MKMIKMNILVISGLLGGVAFMSSDGALSNNETITTSQTVQLLCMPSYRWPTSGETANCVQSSDVSNVQQLTYVEVVANGWTIKSAVPRSSGPNGAYIFVESR